MLTATPPSGRAVTCALSLNNPKVAWCATMEPGLVFAFRVIAKDGNRIEIGARVRSYRPLSKGSSATSDSLLKGVREDTYWLELGKELKIPISDSEALAVTGALMDHMPTLLDLAPGELLDPKPDELRFVSPVLVKGKEVVFDFYGASSIAHGKDQGVEMYVPSEGLYHIAISPLKGAIEGSVEGSRVSFELDGNSYRLLLAAPVTRNEHVWILLDRSFRPLGEVGQHGFISVRDEGSLLVKAAKES